MSIVPLHDRVVIKRLESEKTTTGGIVIPDSAKEKPLIGEVIAVGRGKALHNGELRALVVKPGDRVLIGKYTGNEVKTGGTDYVVVREDDILGILEA